MHVYEWDAAILITTYSLGISLKTRNVYVGILKKMHITFFFSVPYILIQETSTYLQD